MKKKILFIHHGKGVGGAPISMLETIRSLDNARYDSEVLLINDSSVKDMLIAAGVKVSIADLRFYQKYYKFFPHLEPEWFKWWQVIAIVQHSIIWCLSRYVFSHILLRIYKFDIVHLNSSVLSDFLCAASQRGSAVIHIREPVAKGYFGIRLSVIRDQVRRYADKVIAISKDNAARLNCPTKTVVVYNFNSILPKNEINFTPKNKIALYVGGESKIKGFLTIVDALDYLDDGVVVYFCGYYGKENKNYGSIRGFISYLVNILPSRRKLILYRRRLYSHPNAVVLGLRSDIVELVSKSFALVSPFEVEHFSRPIIEAFSCGRCAIGSDVDGMDELIDHRRNGLIVKRNDHIELANSINYLANNFDVCELYGKDGYDKATLYFSPRNIYMIQEVYDNLRLRDCS